MGGTQARVVVPLLSHTIPTNCPAKLLAWNTGQVQDALRRLPQDPLQSLYRSALRALSTHSFHSIPSGDERAEMYRVIGKALNSGQMVALYPVFGTPIEAWLKALAKENLGHIKGAKSSKKKGNSDSPSEEEDKAQVEEKPELTSPKWVLPRDQDPTFQTIKSSPIVHHVFVECQAVDLMPGDLITFSIYLKGRDGAQDVLLEQMSGKIKSEPDGDVARAKFFIGDSFKGKPFDVKKDHLNFIAKHAPKQLEIKSPDLALQPNEFAIWLEIDVDHPKAKDDVVILLDASQGEIKRFKISEMKESQPDRVRIVLGDLPSDQKISLIRDLGPDEEGGKEVLFEDLTPKEITELFGEIS